MKTAELHAADIFDELGPLEEHEQKKFKVERSPVLEEIIIAFQKILLIPERGKVAQMEKTAELLPKEYLSADILAFCEAVAAYQSHGQFCNIAGYFLCSLANLCAAEHIVIRTDHLHPVDHLGSRSCNKHIKVLGDVGAYAGSSMEGGSLHITGSTLNQLGFDSSGSIRVDGNTGMNAGIRSRGTIRIGGLARSGVGRAMRGGTITVEGDVTTHVGQGMRGGEIYLNGEYQSLGGDIQGGNIYHKGKPIVKDGKKL